LRLSTPNKVYDDDHESTTLERRVHLSVITFESLVLERSFLVCRYIFGIFRSSRVIGSRSRSQDQTSVSAYPVCGWPAFDCKV